VSLFYAVVAGIITHIISERLGRIATALEKIANRPR
jgi:hypothetical protein